MHARSMLAPLQCCLESPKASPCCPRRLQDVSQGGEEHLHAQRRAGCVKLAHAGRDKKLEAEGIKKALFSPRAPSPAAAARWTWRAESSYFLPMGDLRPTCTPAPTPPSPTPSTQAPPDLLHLRRCHRRQLLAGEGRRRRGRMAVQQTAIRPRTAIQRLRSSSRGKTRATCTQAGPGSGTGCSST